RLRTVHGRAMPPQWRPDRSDTGPARTLLLPKLLAGAGNFPARLGLVRSGALRGAIMLHRFPEQIFVDRAENFVGEIERPNFLAAQIVYVNRCHICSLCLYEAGALARCLCFLRSSLGGLQRIHRRRTSKPSA